MECAHVHKLRSDICKMNGGAPMIGSNSLQVPKNSVVRIAPCASRDRRAEWAIWLSNEDMTIRSALQTN